MIAAAMARVAFRISGRLNPNFVCFAKALAAMARGRHLNMVAAVRIRVAFLKSDALGCVRD